MDPLQEFAPTVITLVMDILAVVMVATLVRTFLGPRKSDRMVGVNMLGTQSICLIVCLVVRLHENWLVDIAIVYAMFSFLAVTVLTKMDIGVYQQWREDQKKSQTRKRIDSRHPEGAGKPLAAGGGKGGDSGSAADGAGAATGRNTP